MSATNLGSPDMLFKLKVGSRRLLQSRTTTFWDLTQEIKYQKRLMEESSGKPVTVVQVLEILHANGIDLKRARIDVGFFLLECFQSLSKWRSNVKYSDVVVHLRPAYTHLRAIWRSHSIDIDVTFQSVIDEAVRELENSGVTYTPQLLVKAMRQNVAKVLDLSLDEAPLKSILAKEDTRINAKLYQRAQVFCTYARIDHLLQYSRKAPLKVAMIPPDTAVERATLSRGQAQAWLIAALLFQQPTLIGDAYTILKRGGFEDPKKLKAEVELNAKHPLHFLMLEMESAILGIEGFVGASS
jgi:hypothetical protein